MDGWMHRRCRVLVGWCALYTAHGASSSGLITPGSNYKAKRKTRNRADNITQLNKKKKEQVRLCVASSFIQHPSSIIFVRYSSGIAVTATKCP
ncbi:hypothetical protein EX30DRAFT_120032 [Ascodesmis nigricans]|uniref:Secreted protein n=1 Tax=Ascodesmis nigricans TaxID=341454 RepID=A0A4S2MPR9_9PEZI|nr:hypothetical protein EX30DRAFT_120032 [Ascodesmis nigricans]